MKLRAEIAISCALLALCWAALAYAVHSLYTSIRGEPAHDMAVVAAPAPQLAQAPVEWIVPPKPIKTYTAPAKKKLALPAAVQADEQQHVLEATRVAASEAPQTITAVIDETTGETRLYAREEPLPWLDATPRGEAGAFFGLKRNEPTLRLTARQQLLQVKAVRIGVVGSVDAPLNGGELDTYIGVGAWTTW